MKYLILVASLLISVEASAQTRTYAWDPNADVYTVGYALFVGPASGQYTATYDAGGTTSAVVNFTQPGTYYAVVRAYNSNMEFGPPSNEVQTSIVVPPPPTPQPFSVQVTYWPKNKKDKQPIQYCCSNYFVTAVQLTFRGQNVTGANFLDETGRTTFVPKP